MDKLDDRRDRSAEQRDTKKQVLCASKEKEKSDQSLPQEGEACDPMKAFFYVIVFLHECLWISNCSSWLSEL